MPWKTGTRRVADRSYLLSLMFASAVFAGLVWMSGPGSFDFIDGTEFVICGRGLQLAHPPGYPLYVSMLRVFSLLAPCWRLDYSCFRMFSALVAGGALAAACGAVRSMGCSRGGSLAGAVLIMTASPVMAQLNVVEVHGFAMLLVLSAVALRRSPAGPYFFSLSLFAGHPTSVFMLPAALSPRYRQPWLLLALIPLTLWLFVPLRSAFGGLSHYSSPSNADALWRYFTLYGSRLALPTMRGIHQLISSAGVLPLSVMTVLAAASGTWSWKLFASLSGGLVFVSSYSIPDTSSILWMVLLPLGIWASLGLCRLLSRGLPVKLAALALTAAAVFTGISGAWRTGDSSAGIMAEDYMRGAGPEAVLVTSGMSTFHTAYLLEVDDRRPDILPMDTHRCFFRIPPPQELPESIGGRPVFSLRGWDAENLDLHGLLFSSSSAEVDWGSFDIFTYTGRVHDDFAKDEVAEMWARRGIQMDDERERRRCMEEALGWTENPMVVDRIVTIFERY